jgi:hypothetical protein
MVGRGVIVDRPLGRPGEFRTDHRKRYSGRRGMNHMPQLPIAIPGAQWQAGVTPESHRFRVLLDGEPMPLAFAASSDGGWVICFLDAEPVEDEAGKGIVAYRIPREIAETNPATGNSAGHRTLRGQVRIVADC